MKIVLAFKHMILNFFHESYYNLFMSVNLLKKITFFLFKFI